MKQTIPMREALADPDLLGHVIAGDSWSTWRTLLIAAMGEPLTDDERVVFTKFTGREREPLQRVSELEVIAGRRGGKTRAMATLATHIAALCDHRDVLIPGETGVMLCLAQDQRIATKILNFCQEDLERSPILRQLVVARTQDAIELKNNIRIEVRPASFRKLRGPTYVGVIADELAFWYTEDGYANPDVEVLAAARPGLLTTRGMLIFASSPYSKKGVLWDTYRKHYGANGAPLILVAKGTTREFNPTVPQDEIDRELERDPVRNTAEYLATFRSDLESYVLREAVEACISVGVYERPPERGQYYFGFVDPSGGSVDSMTLAIGHMKYGEESLTIDALREAKPPFSPEQVTKEFSELAKSYGVTTIIGDRFGGEWAIEQFSKFGIHYEPSARPKNALYIDFLPLVNSCRVELLDHPRCIAQLCSLERSTVRGRGENFDHPPGQHDDIINAVAGVASISVGKYGGYDVSMRWVSGDDADDPDGARAWRALRLSMYLNSGGRVVL